MIGLSPSVVHKETEDKTEMETSSLSVLEWLTWAPDGDGGLGG